MSETQSYFDSIAGDWDDIRSGYFTEAIKNGEQLSMSVFAAYGYFRV
ncbi:MAG: hypothetical protein M1281_18825 [Chloroflexi bacterium]|nr:hypothetical protein [Chloroflexota bacterium]